MKPSINTKAAPPGETGKTREEVIAEREAKKLAKQNAKKNKGQTPASAPKPAETKPVSSPIPTEAKPISSPKPTETKLIISPKPTETKPISSPKPSEPVETKASSDDNTKSREAILAERAAKKQAKKSGDKKENAAVPLTTVSVVNIVKEEAKPSETVTDSSEGRSKAQVKAERRAKQEAQRAKKADTTVTAQPEVKAKSVTPVGKVPETTAKPKKVVSTVQTSHRVKLFAHLYTQADSQLSALLGVENVHASIARLGAQYRTRVVCGSNARCLALLSALKRVISDYKTPAKEELSRGLDAELTRSLLFLQRCRPASVSMTNAVKHLRAQVLRCKGPETKAKDVLLDWVETYVKDQLEKAAEAISISVRGKISDGDVILTYSCSSLIQKILIAAAREGIRFRVVVVDGRPWLEGRETLRRLLLAGIQCTYILVSALSFVMPEVTKILLGAHALLANGYVMSRCGSSQIALLGRAYNVPVLVCCETHKFSERVQTDSFVHNELGDPNELMVNRENWRLIPNLTPLNLTYDVTPPDLVAAVVTELAFLPCTSVPVILRIK